MKKMSQWQKIVAVLTLLQMRHDIDCLSKRTIVLLGFSNCKEAENIPANFNGSVTYMKRNTYLVDGNLNFKEMLTSPMEFQAIAQRCNMDRSQCEHFNTFLIPDICKVFDQKNRVWSGIMAQTRPKLKCPVKEPVVKIVNATLDYSILAHLPLDCVHENFQTTC